MRGFAFIPGKFHIVGTCTYRRYAQEFLNKYIYIYKTCNYSLWNNIN